MTSELIPVKVAVRCRPLVEKELTEGCRAKVDFYEDYQQVSLPDFEKAFTFDFLFPPSTTQDEVYKKCTPDLLDSLFSGYNATILAYGQTGSGKTYTMGTAYGEASTNPLGIIPRLIDDLFLRLKEKTSFFTVKVSFLEVYNEDIYDLFTATRECVSVREDINGIKVTGMQEIVVNSKEDVFNQLTKGSSNRQTGATNMNKVSSRSHALFTIAVQLTNESKTTTTSKFHLVDLAGSEKAKKTGAQGDRFKEGVNINKGLFALGNVISALCDRSSHIPYRDSRLTRLLQDSLGGNSHTIMIACISPADSNLEETLNTLRYADRARKIKNRPIVNVAPGEKELEEMKQKYFILQTMWTEHMDNCPTTKQLESSPVTNQPESSPVTKQPESSPATKQPESCPDTKQPESCPASKQPESSPATKQQESNPVTKELKDSPSQDASTGPKTLSPVKKAKSDDFANDSLDKEHVDQNSSAVTYSPRSKALQTEVESLMKTNQQLVYNWSETNNIANVYAKKIEQMETTMNDWKLRFEEFTSEMGKVEKSAEENGLPVLPKEMLDLISNISEAIAYSADPEPDKPTLQVNPDELTEIQSCLKDLEDNLFQKQAELMKQKAMTEDLVPLQKIAEKQKIQIQQLEQERSELEDCLKKNPSARISEDRRKKISDLEKQVCLLKKQLELNQKTLKSKESFEKRVKTLNSEIMMLKQSKVSMQKRHEQVKKQMREEKLKAAQQAAQASKKMNTLMFANQKLECRKNVLEQKLREAEMSRKRLETVISKRDSHLTIKGTKQKPHIKDSQKIYEFLAAEIECSVRVEELKQHLEELKRDRACLTAEHKKQKKELEDITMEPPAKKFLSKGEECSNLSADFRAKELTESIKFIEESLNVRSDQITKLMKQIFLFDPDEQKQNLKKFFVSPEEIETGFHYLFRVAARESQRVSKSTQEIEALREQLDSERKAKTLLQNNIQDLTRMYEKERLEERELNQTRLSVLEKEHRSKLLEILHDASSISMYSVQEGSDSKLMDQIQKQVKEISSLNDIQEELKKKSEECDSLQKELKRLRESNKQKNRQTFFVDVLQTAVPVSKPKPKPKLEKLVDAHLEEDEEDDDKDDDNDPDWKRTPLMKTRRFSRIQGKPIPTLQDSNNSETEKESKPEKKSLKRSTSSSSCSCAIDNCKNNRCACRKRNAICNSQCKCSDDSCANKKMMFSQEESALDTTFIDIAVGKENLPQNDNDTKNEGAEADQSKGVKPSKTRKLYTSKKSDLFSFPDE